MNRNLSIFLDICRLSAALLVFIDHARNLGLWPFFRAIAGIGSEAVAVFFVLSGFIIRFVSKEKHESNFFNYTVARLSRVYPVIIISITIGYLSDFVGIFYAKDSYSDIANMHNGTLSEALADITFTNELWFSHTVFGSNGPYWSMGFEVPYYIVFAFISFTQARLRMVLVAGWAALVGPKILLYFTIWLLGVALYSVIQQMRTRRVALGLGIMLAMLVLFSIYTFILHPMKWIYQNAYEAHSLGSLLPPAMYYAGIGIMFAVIVVGFQWASLGMNLFSPAFERLVRWLAGGSFTVYLVHLPVMHMVLALNPAMKNTRWPAIAGMALVLAICFLAAELGERRKYFYRGLIEAIANRFTRPLREGR